MLFYCVFLRAPALSLIASSARGQPATVDALSAASAARTTVLTLLASPAPAAEQPALSSTAAAAPPVTLANDVAQLSEDTSPAAPTATTAAPEPSAPPVSKRYQLSLDTVTPIDGFGDNSMNDAAPAVDATPAPVATNDDFGSFAAADASLGSANDMFGTASNTNAATSTNNDDMFGAFDAAPASTSNNDANSFGAFTADTQPAVSTGDDFGSFAAATPAPAATPASAATATVTNDDDDFGAFTAPQSNTAPSSDFDADFGGFASATAAAPTPSTVTATPTPPAIQVTRIITFMFHFSNYCYFFKNLLFHRRLAVRWLKLGAKQSLNVWRK